jgi:endoglucanase
MDDKVGLWVVLEAFRRAVEAGPLACSLHVASTVQEEIGLRGAQTSAFGVDPQVAIAVDVTHATDCPTMDQKQGGDIKLGGGPVIERGPNVNPRLFTRLVDTANNQQIPYQIAAHNRGTGTDANAIQLSRAGVVTGLVSIPNRYMHSAVETIALDDIDKAADLLAAFMVNLIGIEDFTP